MFSIRYFTNAKSLKSILFGTSILSSLHIHAQEWKSLFNGKNLDEWKVCGDSATHKVVDSAIVGKTNLNSPIDEGAKSTLLYLLANISGRLDKSFELDSSNGHIYDREGMKLWRREYALGFEPQIK